MRLAALPSEPGETLAGQTTMVPRRTRVRPVRTVAREESPRAPDTAAVAADALLLWCVFLAVAVAAFVTYTRLPARELYHVSHPRVGAGIRRALAFAGFPAAPVAVPLIAYGGANVLQDFWLEQIVKRDLLGWQFPYMLQPRPDWHSQESWREQG